VKLIVQDPVQEVFDIREDSDIIVLDPTHSVVGDPDPNDLRIDMLGKISSPWNSKLIRILEEQVRGMTTEEGLPEKSFAYNMDLLQNCLRML